MINFGITRDVPVQKDKTALLIVDVQYLSTQNGSQYAHLDTETIYSRYSYFFQEMDKRVLPNIKRLQQSCRINGIEVIFTVIESLTQDGRDIGLDYKISGLFCAKGSKDAQVLDAIAPVGDEMVIPKSSSSPFISTNIHYILGNLGIKHLIVCGILTDQCIDSTVRDACDYGYLVSLVTDACATHSKERHNNSLANNHGYCRQILTDNLVDEINNIRCLINKF